MALIAASIFSWSAFTMAFIYSWLALIMVFMSLSRYSSLSMTNCCHQLHFQPPFPLLEKVSHENDYAVGSGMK
jgi:hypothetical protein